MARNVNHVITCVYSGPGARGLTHGGAFGICFV